MVSSVASHLPSELVAAIQKIYEPAGIRMTSAALCEAESAEYGACRLSLNGYAIVFRVAKMTPTKLGQFVTLWKRPISGGAIAPLDINDGVDFVVVSVHDEARCGQFVFDKNLLVAKGVMSRNGKGGKRAIRLYPPWVKPKARDAVKTQQWQSQCFFMLTQEGTADSVLVRHLFKI